MEHKYKEEFFFGPVEKNSNNFVALIMDHSNGITTKRVIYHNADEDVPTFKDFIDYVMEEFSSTEKVSLHKPDKEGYIFLQNHIVEGSDYDEETRASWKTYDVEGVAISFYNGFDWEKIQDLISKLSKDYSESEKMILSEHMESLEEKKDPYAARGLNRMDFY